MIFEGSALRPDVLKTAKSVLIFKHTKPLDIDNIGTMFPKSWNT